MLSVLVASLVVHSSWSSSQHCFQQVQHEVQSSRVSFLSLTVAPSRPSRNTPNMYSSDGLALNIGWCRLVVSYTLSGLALLGVSFQMPCLSFARPRSLLLSMSFFCLYLGYLPLHQDVVSRVNLYVREVFCSTAGSF